MSRIPVLTDTEKEEVVRLVEAGATAGQIAKALDRRPSTIGWYMYLAGLRAREKRPPRAPYTRADGTRVTPFQPEEDDMIERLRAEDQLTPRQIADRLREAFGREVKPHSVKVRLVVLASHRACAEDA